MIPDSYFEGFVTAKYRSRNPVQRTLIRRFLEKISSLFDAAPPSKAVLEVGCGEGFIAGHLSEGRHRGSIYDLSFLRRDFDLVDLKGGTKEVFKRRQAGGTFELIGHAHTWQLYRTVPTKQTP